MVQGVFYWNDLFLPGAEDVNLVSISDNTELSLGETVVLSCIAYGRPGVTFTWIHKEEVVTNSSLISVTESDFPEPGGLFRQSFLQICSADISDLGTYSCSVSNGLVSVDASTVLSVAGESYTQKLTCVMSSSICRSWNL